MRRPQPKGGSAGFTLIELMLVVALVAILASVAVTLFGDTLAKAQEATTKGNLAALRAALGVYIADNESAAPTWPTTRVEDALTANGKYIERIPFAYLPKTPNNIGHKPSNNINQFNLGGGPMADILGYAPPVDQIGGWLYDARDPNTPGNDGAQPGQFLVSCSHTDLKGVSWTKY